MRVRFIAAADVELADAVAHYNGLLSGLGAEFAAEVRDGLGRIKEYLKAWQLLGPRVRRYRLNRFPYGLVYMLLQSEIVVLAVMHLHTGSLIIGKSGRSRFERPKAWPVVPPESGQVMPVLWETRDHSTDLPIGGDGIGAFG